MKKILGMLFGRRDEKLRERCLRLAKGNVVLAEKMVVYVKSGHLIDYDSRDEKWKRFSIIPEEASPES